MTVKWVCKACNQNNSEDDSNDLRCTVCGTLHSDEPLLQILTEVSALSEGDGITPSIEKPRHVVERHNVSSKNTFQPFQKQELDSSDNIVSISSPGHVFASEIKKPSRDYQGEEISSNIQDLIVSSDYSRNSEIHKYGPRGNRTRYVGDYASKKLRWRSILFASVVLVVCIVVCFCFSMRFRQLSNTPAMLNQSQPQQLPTTQSYDDAKSPETRISTSQSTVPTPLETTQSILTDKDPTQDEKISSIKSWYYAFTDHMDDCRRSVMHEGWTAYWYGEEVVAINYRSAVGPDGSYSESWYYHDGDLYFIYLRGENGDSRVLRLYFWEGQLIRWIEADGIVHNTDNDFYASNYENGMDYYWEARSAG